MLDGRLNAISILDLNLSISSAIGVPAAALAHVFADLARFIDIVRCADILQSVVSVHRIRTGLTFGVASSHPSPFLYSNPQDST